MAPLFPNGHLLGLTRCYSHSTEPSLNDTMDPWVISGLQHGGGWRFVTHQMHVRRPGDVPKYKPGWVSTTVGAVLQFEIDTSSGGGREAAADDPPHRSTVNIVYLQSYEHMGMVRVSCVSGCTCINTDMTIDAHNVERVSVHGYKALYITPAARCVMQLVVLPESNCPPADVRHKFKLISVTVDV